MKRFFLIIFGLIVTGSIVLNIKTQYGTLEEAKKQNIKMEGEIAALNQENQILEQKIAYATSSAYLEQEAHDKLGLGNENDVWLKLTQEQNLDLYPKMNEEVKIPKIRQWINLFTQ